MAFPTYADRQSYGRQLSDREIAVHIADAPVGGGLEWRHVGVLATILGESNGYEWSRPMVWKQDDQDVYHLSVDRGICAFNSARREDGTYPTYWGPVPDRIAYDPPLAIAFMVEWLHTEANEGTKGAKPWDWRPLLDWQWHAFVDLRDSSISGERKANWRKLMKRARDAVNEVRVSRGLEPL
jgi:hypothetical protein